MSNAKAPMHRLDRSSGMAVPDVVHRPRERKNHGCCSTRNPLCPGSVLGHFRAKLGPPVRFWGGDLVNILPSVKRPPLSSIHFEDLCGSQG